MKKNILGGAGTAFLAWIMLFIADFIDEIILDTASFFGFIMYIAVPLCMFVFYIIHYITKKPETKKIVIWFLSYIIVCSLIWAVVYFASEKDFFIIKQKVRSSFFDLNGIEYILYGFSVIGLFTILCILFHIIWNVVRFIINNGVKNKKLGR